VADNVRFFQEAVSGSIEGIDSAVAGTGWVLTNPPYGVRVGDAGDLRNLYAKLGSTLGEKGSWRLGVLTADLDLVRQTKLPLRARFSTSNGGIPVTFFASEKTGA
jgi:23S rRNA G2445 N2-methylase RlmL